MSNMITDNAVTFLASLGLAADRTDRPLVIDNFDHWSAPADSQLTPTLFSYTATPEEPAALAA